jgi:predicted transcriptional regulator
MKYRSKIDIIGHILEAVNSRGSGYTGLTKSKIMYNVLLSYAQLQGYLSDLVENGLIEKYQKELKAKDKRKKQSSYYYRITDKGRRFLQVYREINQMIA